MNKLNTYLLQTKPVLVRINRDQALWGNTPYDDTRTKFDLETGQRFWATRALVKLEDDKQTTMLLVFKSGMLIKFAPFSPTKNCFDFLGDGHELNTNWMGCVANFNYMCSHSQILIPKNK